MPIIVDFPSQRLPIKVQSIVDRAGKVLNDEDHVRWTVPELIDWINEAATAIVPVKPSAGAKSAVMYLTAGSMQKIDTPVVQLLDVVRNMAADGVTPGRSIRMTERHLLDSLDPDWHSGKPSKTIKHFVFDDRTPDTFYVYPPAVEGAKVQIAYAAVPAEVDSVTDELDLNIEYSAAVLNYVLFRSYSKDSEFANGQIASSYLEAFMGAIGAKASGEQSTTPTAKVPA